MPEQTSEFDREIALFDLGQNPNPYVLAEHETDEQRAITQRLLDGFSHGLELVQVEDVIGGLERGEVCHAAMSTVSLQLSSFCRGNCRECALNAAPYSSKNRKVFEINSLIQFLETHRMGGLGELTLYDASDPLDYPWLLQLLAYFKQNGNYRRINIKTSCPPGTEEVLEKVLALSDEKFRVNLSILPSTRERQEQQGVLEIVQNEARERMERAPWSFESKIHPVEPRSIGRNHYPGSLAAGFSCGDMTVLNPELGFCSADYHIASDLYPNERDLRPITESRRIPMYNSFGMLSFGGFLSNQARTVTPETTYIDLDAREFRRETALRHLVSYVYSVAENLGGMKDCSHGVVRGLEMIEAALKAGTFVMPTDERELAFYRKLIPRMLDESERFMATMFTPGLRLFGSSGFNPGHYVHLVKEIRRVLDEHKEVIFGEDVVE